MLQVHYKSSLTASMAQCWLLQKKKKMEMEKMTHPYLKIKYVKIAISLVPESSKAEMWNSNLCTDMNYTVIIHLLCKKLLCLFIPQNMSFLRLIYLPEDERLVVHSLKFLKLERILILLPGPVYLHYKNGLYHLYCQTQSYVISCWHTLFVIILLYMTDILL